MLVHVVERGEVDDGILTFESSCQGVAGVGVGDSMDFGVGGEGGFGASAGEDGDGKSRICV